MTGERRMGSNPFDGFGLKDTKNDRRRVARAITLEELRRLLDAARRRPLDEALTIRVGPTAGEQTAEVRPKRRDSFVGCGGETSHGTSGDASQRHHVDDKHVHRRSVVGQSGCGGVITDDPAGSRTDYPPPSLCVKRGDETGPL